MTVPTAVWSNVAVVLAKVPGHSSMGRRPAGADKRVRGHSNQLGVPIFVLDI